MVKFGASHHKPGVKTVVREGKTFQTNNKPPRKGENVTDLHFGSYIGREVVYTDIWRLARKMCPATPKPKVLNFRPSARFGFPKTLGTRNTSVEVEKRSETTNLSFKPEFYECLTVLN